MLEGQIEGLIEDVLDHSLAALPEGMLVVLLDNLEGSEIVEDAVGVELADLFEECRASLRRVPTPACAIVQWKR